MDGTFKIINTYVPGVELLKLIKATKTAFTYIESNPTEHYSNAVKSIVTKAVKKYNLCEFWVTIIKEWIEGPLRESALAWSSNALDTLFVVITDSDTPQEIVSAALAYAKDYPNWTDSGDTHSFTISSWSVLLFINVSTGSLIVTINKD